MSQEQSEQAKTNDSQSTSEEEYLQQVDEFVTEWKSTLSQREDRAKRRHDQIAYNLREIEGQKKHRITRILLRYLRQDAFDSMLALRALQELFDFVGWYATDKSQRKENFIKEVAPRIMELLQKGSKMAAEEEDETQSAPSNRLFDSHLYG